MVAFPQFHTNPTQNTYNNTSYWCLAKYGTMKNCTDCIRTLDQVMYTCAKQLNWDVMY